jgi:hypothetical protein
MVCAHTPLYHADGFYLETRPINTLLAPKTFEKNVY